VLLLYCVLCVHVSVCVLCVCVCVCVCMCVGLVVWLALSLSLSLHVFVGVSDGRCSDHTRWWWLFERREDCPIEGLPAILLLERASHAHSHVSLRHRAGRLA
jgi:hypothetical protein